MNSKNLCGIDVGCTNIKMMAVINNMPVSKTIPSGDDLTRKQLVDAIKNFYLSFKINFDGIGIAFSGCTSDSIRVDSTTLPCIQGFSVTDLADLNCKNIKLINDSNAATLAGTIEYPNSKVLVGITNGTGIGCGVSIKGKLFTGSSGFLGEVYGNPILNGNGNITKIGRICSGSKILKKLNNAKSENDRKELINKASIYLGILLVQFINFYNPDVIYFSGGGFSFDDLLDDAIEFAKKNSYSHLSKNVVFAKSTYHGYAGCVGAMKLVSEK